MGGGSELSKAKGELGEEVVKNMSKPQVTSRNETHCFEW